MRLFLTELIGTFFLVLTIGLTVLAHLPLAAMAIGLSLMVMVYMGGGISGAHYNPAVTIAVAMRGALAAGLVPLYMSAQLAGAILAALVVRGVTGHTFAPAPDPAASTIAALAIELLFTFALCLVVLNVAVSERARGNSYFGLAIGFTIVAAAFAGGPISGGAFNPAVGIGPTVIDAAMGGGPLGHLWLYIVGPIAGAVLAALVHAVQEG